MIDIDHFKSVNDRWGHAAGDQVLKQVAETLRGRVRVFDSLARYGGEEFVVIMSGASSADAMRAAERLRLAIQSMEFMPDEKTQHRLTVSIGISRSTRADITSEQLLGAADRALLPGEAPRPATASKWSCSTSSRRYRVINPLTRC